MIFNSLPFLFLFLPIILLAFFGCKSERFRLWLLLAGSLLFYAVSGLEHAAVLIAGIVWTYVIAASDAIRGSWVRLGLAIAGPLLALFHYKYFGFVMETLTGGPDGDAAFSLFESVILPAGISFFTFQLVAYAIDRFRGDIETPPAFARFALYVSFFPQLVAGPILRFHQVREPISRLSTFTLNRHAAMQAIAYIVAGLSLKVLLADTLGNYNAAWIDRPESLTVSTAVFVLLSYSFQIYYDFFGYSLIAIGLGKLFGFDFPDNFLRPYQSLNIKDFWRRWHITLSFWIRDYLYLPLGGNRHYARNIIIVFAICGLWHGAGFPFIVWGLYHGGLVALYNVTARFWDAMPSLLQVSLTFLLVSLGWTLFVFDFQDTVTFFNSLAGFGSGLAPAPDIEHWAVLALAAFVCFVPGLETALARAGSHATWRDAVIYAGFAVAVLLFLNRSHTFIYFRF